MHKDVYQIELLSVGQLATNCYIVFDTSSKDAVIIDPGDDGGYIAEKIIFLHVYPQAILLTHGHFDHTLGAFELQKIFDIPVYMNRKDIFLIERMKKSAEYYLHRLIIEQPPTITPISTKKTSFGTIVIDSIATPGHTPGGMSYIFTKDDVIFTGDTLFSHGGIGRTDLSYSKPIDLVKSIERLFTLPESCIVYPGHGDTTTIGQEKKIWKEHHV